MRTINLKDTALSLLAMLSLLTAFQPAQAQIAFTSGISPASGSYMSSFNARFSQIGGQISNAMATGQLTQYNGNNLMQGLSLLESQANTCWAGGGFTDAQAATLGTQINSFAQEVTDFIATNAPQAAGWGVPFPARYSGAAGGAQRIAFYHPEFRHFDHERRFDNDENHQRRFDNYENHERRFDNYEDRDNDRR